MYITTQFSVFMVNKPGVLAHALGEFAKAKLNLVAMTMVDAAENGVMRAVFESPSEAREILSRLNMPFNETDVLCVTLTNRSGALACVAEKLARSHINISYAYCTAGAKGGKTTGVFKLADVKKAMKILEQSDPKKDKSELKIRPPKSSRRR
jgi:hypothetical protein